MNDSLKHSPLRWLLVLAIVAAAIWVSHDPDAAQALNRAAAAVIWPGDCTGCPTPGVAKTGCAEDCAFCPPAQTEPAKPPAQAPAPETAPTTQPAPASQPEAPKPAGRRKTT